MFRQKYLSLFIIAMMFFVIASGGCGGSSSSNRHENDNSNPDNPTTEYDISVLQGTWAASNGTARWVENGETVDGVPDEKESSSYSFSEIQLNGDIATIFMGGETIWIKQNQNGSHGMAYGIRARKFQNIDRNVWHYESENGSNAYTITITSPTTADIEEEILEKEWTWTARYTLTKQTTAIPTINGTWRIAGGSLTYQDNGTTRTLNYGGSSSPAQFTLTISDTGEGDYIINVSGAGVFKKEGSPYIKAKFEGISENVRVVWGSSEDRESFGGGTEYKRTDTETYTYSAEFPSVIHDVSTASFRLSQPSRITYTQTGKSIERPESYYLEHNTEEEPTVTVELYLSRVD